MYSLSRHGSHGQQLRLVLLPPSQGLASQVAPEGFLKALRSVEPPELAPPDVVPPDVVPPDDVPPLLLFAGGAQLSAPAPPKLTALNVPSSV